MYENKICFWGNITPLVIHYLVIQLQQNTKEKMCSNYRIMVKNVSKQFKLNTPRHVDTLGSPLETKSSMSLYQECTKLKPNWHFISISDIQSCTYFIIKAYYGVEWIMTFNHMRSVHLQHLNTERKRLKSSSINKHISVRHTLWWGAVRCTLKYCKIRKQQQKHIVSLFTALEIYNTDEYAFCISCDTRLVSQLQGLGYNLNNYYTVDVLLYSTTVFPQISQYPICEAK